MEIRSDNVNSLFIKACHLVKNGNVTYPRGLKVHEVRNVVFELTNPNNNVVTVKDRNISFKYLIAEWLWYVGARQDKLGADFIVKYAPFWNTIRNNDGSLNSNYGYYFFNKMDEVLPTEEEFKPISDYYFQKSQFDYVIDALLNDSGTRQAVVNINNIYHKAHPTKDFPCTTTMQFMLRNNMLNMTVTMRSTDLVLGFCNDIFQFTMFQFIVLNELRKRCNNDCTYAIGDFTLFTSSLHYYERHEKMVNSIIEHNKNDIVSAEIDVKDEFKDAVKLMKELEYEDFKVYFDYIFNNKNELTSRNTVVNNVYTLFNDILGKNNK